MALNRIMVSAGIITLLQAAGQMFFTGLGIAQFFCLIDFLRGLPLLIYIKILYYHNPDTCGTRVNIGEAIDSIANQAFVLISNLPMPAFRTFIINCVSLGLSVLWVITSVVITTWDLLFNWSVMSISYNFPWLFHVPQEVMSKEKNIPEISVNATVIMGGAKNKQSKGMRWPWIIITTAICGLDLVASVIYANDSFHTRTLSDMMDFIGGVASGASGVQLDTSWASWIMVLLYSRFVVLFVVNVILLIMVIVSLNMHPGPKTDDVQVEAPVPIQAVPQTSAPTQVSTAVQSSPPPTPPPPPPPGGPPIVMTQESSSERDEEAGSMPSEPPSTRIPRAGLSRSFRTMKNFLFRKPSTPEVHRRRSIPESIEMSPDISSRTQHIYIDKKRMVNFPESLLSLPQRLENIIAEQQRRLDKSVIDTSGRNSPPRASQSMPQLATTSTQADGRGRRGTTAELQGQLPWAYIPASAHRMRDQLPPDEDLPPVPLPDYTALPSVRKASVHRAASSLSSLNPKRDYATSQSVRSPLNQADVLY